MTTPAFWDNASYVYGTAGRVYDDPPATFSSGRLEWRFECAWKGGSQFFAETTGKSEADKLFDYYMYRGRPELVKYNGSGMGMFQAGRMVVCIRNPDDRYNPNNTSSDLYGYITPGKLCRIGVRKANSNQYGPDKSYIWRFTGVVTDIKVHREPPGKGYVEITAKCGWGYLQEAEIYLPSVFQETIAAFMERVMRAVQWPWGSDLGGSETLPHLFAGGIDARQVLHDLADAVGGHLWIDGMGRLRYEKRTATLSLAASFEDEDITNDPEVTRPWDNQFNVIEMGYAAPNADKASTCGVLWGNSPAYTDENTPPTYWGDLVFDWQATIPEISIPTGESAIVGGSYSVDRDAYYITGGGTIYGWPRTSELIIAVPSPSVTYVDEGRPMLGIRFWTGSGGTGTDVTGYVKVEFEDGGAGFRAKLTNNYSATVYSELMAVASHSVTTVNSESKVTIDNSSGAARKKLKVRSPYAILDATYYDLDDVRSVADYYGDLLLAAAALPTISIVGKPDIQFRDIKERIGIYSAELGILTSFLVSWIEERFLVPTGQVVSTMLKTEPAVLGGFGFLIMQNGDYVLNQDGDKIAIG